MLLFRGSIGILFTGLTGQTLVLPVGAKGILGSSSEKSALIRLLSDDTRHCVLAGKLSTLPLLDGGRVLSRSSWRIKKGTGEIRPFSFGVLASKDIGMAATRRSSFIKCTYGRKLCALQASSFINLDVSVQVSQISHQGPISESKFIDNSKSFCFNFRETLDFRFQITGSA